MVGQSAVVAVQLEEAVDRLSGRHEELSTTADNAAVDEELIITDDAAL